MDAPRVFTIAEVDGLIPTLAPMVEAQVRLGKRISEIVRAVHERSGRALESLEPDPGDSSEMLSAKKEIAKLHGEATDGWHEIETLGAIVKDPITGLLDFYGRLDGRLVWLCWRLGETSLEHFHELDAGFSGRKPLTRETKNRLLN